jgi:hypothetical protein
LVLYYTGKAHWGGHKQNRYHAYLKVERATRANVGHTALPLKVILVSQKHKFFFTGPVGTVTIPGLLVGVGWYKAAK